ncbi:unnamed protein product [Brassicogethes aeneus]|uniref:Uncharacterized protein n=1 Tax=Brassicogethes aeneus TaxID=1431903 RepID=A0A9P0B312_BRAAE|nr:unnamed protein product [Brassicogethes aeneus]
MSKKIPDTFQPKITRNDRFAQMSQQEKIIEQKKKEILEKLEAKQKANAENAKNAKIAKDNKSTTKKEDTKAEINVFSNDGSFLDQFKQMKDKRLDSKLKSFRQREHSFSDDHNKNRYKPKKRSPSPKERPKPRISRFDKTPSYEPKITFNTSFSSTITQPQYEIQPPIAILPQNVTGQPLLKNIVVQPTVAYPTVSNESIITAPPVLINVPPPQIVQGPLVMPPNQQQAVLVQNQMVSLPPNTILNTLPPPSTILNTPPPPNMAVSAPPVLPVPPPATMSVLSTVELTSIPPPSPIQVQSIPQPEPMNTMNIPHPAPMQVQNIPTPEPVQLNDIPNPRPMDVLSIPTPGEDNVMSDFIKSIPPPNKSIPPPSLQDVHQTSLNLLPSNILPLVSTVQNLPTQSMLVNVPPPHPIQNTFTSISVPLPVTVTTVVNSIPSLMAQPILPPPGINVNVSCPPPMMTMLQQPPPPMFVTQPPPLTNQMPPMNVPPPNANLMSGFMPGLRDMNAVFPPGTPDYEQMASLGRMVAECGTGIEDVVRQRKTQDPSLWYERDKNLKKKYQ